MTLGFTSQNGVLLLSIHLRQGRERPTYHVRDGEDVYSSEDGYLLLTNLIKLLY
jgi:hypothetical protein